MYVDSVEESVVPCPRSLDEDTIARKPSSISLMYEYDAGNDEVNTVSNKKKVISKRKFPSKFYLTSE